jgi:hypothetical protein
VPAHVDGAAIDTFLRAVPGVVSIHYLHIWGIGTRETALTVHLVMLAGHPGEVALQALSHGLQERFAINHSTVQVDFGDGCHRRGGCWPGTGDGRLDPGRHRAGLALNLRPIFAFIAGEALHGTEHFTPRTTAGLQGRLLATRGTRTGGHDGSGHG